MFCSFVWDIFISTFLPLCVCLVLYISQNRKFSVSGSRGLCRSFPFVGCACSVSLSVQLESWRWCGRRAYGILGVVAGIGFHGHQDSPGQLRWAQYCSPSGHGLCEGPERATPELPLQDAAVTKVGRSCEKTQGQASLPRAWTLLDILAGAGSGLDSPRASSSLSQNCSWGIGEPWAVQGASALGRPWQVGWSCSWIKTGLWEVLGTSVPYCLGRGQVDLQLELKLEWEWAVRRPGG